jgi:hypothetical protein
VNRSPDRLASVSERLAAPSGRPGPLEAIFAVEWFPDGKRVLTPDGQSYVYRYERRLDALYVVEGLR